MVHTTSLMGIMGAHIYPTSLWWWGYVSTPASWDHGAYSYPEHHGGHKGPRPIPLDNIWVMMIVWRLRGNIIRTALCWIVWHNVHSQQHTYVSSSYRSNRLGLSHWHPYAVHRGGCLELYYCNMVEWFWCDSSLIFDDQLVSFSALTLLVWSCGLQKLSPKWPIMCWVGR